MGKLSVIMSTYNEPAEHIHQSVGSILAQTMTDFEYIIVLDNPDNAMIESIIRDYAAKDSRIRVVKNEKNLGLVGALNHALQYVSGDYVARMDGDDIAAPDRFEKQLQYMQEHELDLSGTLIRRMDEQGNLLVGMETRHYPPQVIMKSLRVVDCVPHSPWMLRREVYETLGGYRDIHRSEDYDFLLRCLKRGYRIGLCDEYLMDCRVAAAGISQSGLLRQRLTAKYLSKNYPRLDEVNMDEIRREVLDKISDKDCDNFRKADMLFIEALSHRHRNPLKTVWLLLRSATTSRYYIGKFTDMLRLRIIRKAY